MAANDIVLLKKEEALRLVTNNAIKVADLGGYNLMRANIEGVTIPNLEILVSKTDPAQRGFIAFWWNKVAVSFRMNSGTPTTLTNELRDAPIQMSDPGETAKIQERLDRYEVTKLVAGGTLVLPHVLGLISWIPDMSQTAILYSMKPDQGVQITNQYSRLLIKWNILPPVDTAPVVYNTSRMACQGYAVLIAMVKPTTGSDFSTVLKRRMKAFSYTLGVEGSYIDPDVCTHLVDELRLMAEKISFFPTLISRVFTMLVSSAHEQTSHVREIFRQASLTVFGFIHMFLKTPTLTLLHLDPSIFEDIKKFHATFERIYNKHGEDWVYFRLLEPNNGDTSSKRFPNLASAALSWMYVSTKAETLKKFQGVSVAESYMKAAGKNLNQRYLKLKGGLNKDMAEFLAQTGVLPSLNVDEIKKAIEEGGELVFAD
nr:MAG: hypothetical protein [Culex mononega-like virus 1]